MRFISVALFVLFNVYLIEGSNRTESVKSDGDFESENSENVPVGADGKSDDVFYDEYEYEDGNRENSIVGKSSKEKENGTEVISGSDDGFPNEVFLTLRNITADAATAFRSFTNRNDVVDLQASASDNLNVTSNSSYGDLESAGINLRALRDAGHPPVVIEESLGVAHLPYKHTKIDTADLSDCALQGEWKPIGVAHGHLHVEGDNSHQAEVLQSVGSYTVPNKVIPHWQQNLVGNQGIQGGILHHKPSGLYAGGTGGGNYGSSFGYGFGSGLGSGSAHSSAGIGGVGGAPNHHYGGGSFSGGNLGQFQKIKSASMLAPPPVPPIILGKKPGYWKLPKTKHKFFPAKGRRPGYQSGGSHGFSNHASGYLSHGGGAAQSGALLSGYGGGGYGSGGYSALGGSSHSVHSIGNGGLGISGGSGGLHHGFRVGGKGVSSAGGSSHGFQTGTSGGSLSISAHGFGNGGVGGAGKYSLSSGSGHGGGGGGAGGYSFSSGSGHGGGGGAGGAGGYSFSSGSGHGGRGGAGGAGGYSIISGSGHGGGGGGAEGYSFSSGSGHVGGGGGGAGGAGGYSILSNSGHGAESGGFSEESGHGHGVETEGELSISEGSSQGYGGGNGGLPISGSSSHDLEDGGSSETLGSGYDGGDDGSLSLSGVNQISHGDGGGAAAAYLIAGTQVLPSNSAHESGGTVEDDSSGYLSQGNGIGGGHLISSTSGTIVGQPALIIHGSGPGLTGGRLVAGPTGGNNLLPDAAFLSTEVNKVPNVGGHHADSTFSSTHISQGLNGGNALPDAAFLSSHINQDFAVHGQGISDSLSSSSTFTCGKNHDHNTNYHTATFQVADHDHPSSVDVLQYGGGAAVLIKSGDAPFHDHTLPERKHYKASIISDAEASGTDNRNELTSQAEKLTSLPTEQELGNTETEVTKADDGDEPERHSYYHEITKVTKIPANTVGSVEYTFSKYETKPQTFSTESETVQEEPEVEQPQIIRELEHLSDKFQLDLENPKKLFEDPPSQELAYHYPFQDVEHNHEGGSVENVKDEGHKEIKEFPFQFYHNPNKVVQYPNVIVKKPIIKYIPRPGKPHFHQKTSVNYLQPKPPLVLLRKPKPKQFLKKKQNYEVHEHGGERQRPIGEIFPPQKFPKQFHNPKPNFAVDRPKNGWRPDVYQEYKYDHLHGKKVRKFKAKGKVVAPIIIRRPVSPAPVIRVVEVTG